MKKKSPLSTLCYSFLFLGLGALFSFVPSSSSNVEIEFGRGPSCIGRGVCSIDEPSEGGGNDIGYPSLIREASGQFYLDQENRFVLDLFKDSMTAATIAEQFADGYFEQLETIDLPGYLIQDNNGSNDYQIKTGVYPVLDLPDKFSITF